MNLQLPPSRPLPNAEQMVEQILDDELVRRRRPTGQRWLGGLVAAVVALLLVAVGIAVLSPRNRPEVADPPLPTATALTPSPQPPTGPEQHVLGERAVFDHFTVTLTHVHWTRGEGLDVEAAVCVRSLPPDPTGNTTRISWDPWSVGGQGPVVRANLGADLTPFPRDTYARVGQCVTGWLSFAGATAGAPNETEVDYANQLGDQAHWRVDPSAAFTIGQTVELPYVSVTLSTAGKMGNVYVVSVKTCVRALPPGTPNSGLVLREDAWTVMTDTGQVTIDDPLDGVPPLPTTFPPSRRAAVGDCVSGFVPFGTGAKQKVDGVFYRDPYGQSASWRVDR